MALTCRPTAASSWGASLAGVSAVAPAQQACAWAFAGPRSAAAATSAAATALRDLELDSGTIDEPGSERHAQLPATRHEEIHVRRRIASAALRRHHGIRRRAVAHINHPRLDLHLEVAQGI